MSTVITGAAGFIGSHYANSLANLGVDVIAVDCLTYAGKLSNIDVEKMLFYEVDIRDKDKLEKIFKKNKVDTIVNFAAETHVDNSINNPTPFLTTNIMGVMNLLDCSAKFNVEKFIQISTDEVFGSLESGYANEDARLNPSSPYSASKASAELLINSYFKTYQVSTKIIRLSNNYGPKQYDEKLIPYTLKQIAKNMKIGIYGNGMNIREWLYVDDAVNAINMIISNGRVNQSYNVSSGEFKNNLEVVSSILNYFGMNDSMIEFVDDRKGHDYRYAIDAQKITNELGWKTEVKFEAGISKTIDWYISNRDWWNKTK
jgi:dTDP-glucose 4,6-dehydratase